MADVRTNPSQFLTKWEDTNQLICGVDIDGVLNHYPDPWVHFVNHHLGTHYNNLVEVKEIVPYNQYRRLKKMYREGDVKGTLKPRINAKGLLEALNQIGYTIIILTARPVHEYPNLYRVTEDWLLEHFSDDDKRLYDSIIFEKEKHIEIIRRYPRLKFMIDDHRHNANLISSWGYRVFLVDNIYNQGEIHSNVIRVEDLGEIIYYVM